MNPEALVPGEASELVVTLTNTTTGATSQAGLVVHVNQGPHCTVDDCVEVSPTEGIAFGETEFVVEALGWVDSEVDSGSGEQFLRYRFGYCTTPGCSDPASFFTVATQDSNVFTFRSLREGVNDSYELTLRVCAVDFHSASRQRLSETCQNKNIVVLPSTAEVSSSGLLQALSFPGGASREEQLVAVQIAVNQVRNIGEGSQEEREEVVSQLVEVTGQALRDGNVDPDVIDQVTQTLNQAGTDANVQTRRNAVRILVDAANILEDAAAGDSDTVGHLGTNIMKSLGSMLRGYGSPTDDNGSAPGQSGIQDDLQEVARDIASTFLRMQTPEDPFTTLGELVSALTMGKRTSDQLNGLDISVSPGGSDERRRSLLQLEAQPSIIMPDTFSASCQAPGSCPATYDVAVSYFDEASFLLASLGSPAFTKAVADFKGLVDLVGIEVKLVTGMMTAAMPNRPTTDLGGIARVSLLTDNTLYSAGTETFCVTMKTLPYEPVVVARPTSIDTVSCICPMPALGDYICVQATFSADPDNPPSPPPTPVPTTSPPPPTWKADAVPTDMSMVSATVTFDGDIDSIKTTAFAAAFQTAVAAKLDDVEVSSVLIRAIKPGSVVVDFAILVDDDAKADAIGKSLKNAGADFFASLASEYGTVLEVSEPAVQHAFTKDDGGISVGIIAGAAAGSVVVAVMVVVIAVLLLRRRRSKIGEMVTAEDAAATQPTVVVS
mmetsp:Transcript_38006/g.107366  ORF Transcript_38006/g.107366 Transcript_38006/m.107366 type:complete len:720 (-) Transcript_38006:141-2300(-)